MATIGRERGSSSSAARWSISGILFACVAACSQPEATPKPSSNVAKASFEVELFTVARAPVQRVVHTTGSLFGEEQTTVSAKVSGRVVAVHHDVGDVVAPGIVLAALEARDYELAVAERRAAVAQAAERIGSGPDIAPDFDVQTLPAVDRARLQAENAFARFDRGRILHERTPPAVSDQDFLDLRTAWDVAVADHKLAALAARAQIAEMRTLQAQLATAEQRLADTRHLVPSGVRPSDRGSDVVAGSKAEYAISARYVSVGDFVNVGARLFELIDPDPLEARVRVPEREMARVRVGAPARVHVDAYTDEFVGRAARINPSVDIATRTFEVEVVVPNADGRLRAGSFARVAIEAEQDPTALLVPLAAVTTFAGVHKVFVAKDGLAAERVVGLGDTLADSIEVRSGIKEGDVIVARPPLGLSTGSVLRGAEVRSNGGAADGAK